MKLQAFLPAPVLTPSPPRAPPALSPRPRPPVTTMVDTNTLLAIGASVLGVGGGVGLLVFYEKQGARTDARQNTQPCTECKGVGETVCEICGGSGKNVLKDDGVCSYCETTGKIRCMNCAGRGIQPRFLDRYGPDDFMD